MTTNTVGFDEDLQHLYRTYFGELQHERAAIETLPRHLEGVDLFIDVGASLGLYTYTPIAAYPAQGLLLSSQTLINLASLEQSCRKWGQDGANEIVAIQASVSDRSGTIGFYQTGSSGGLFPVDERPASHSALEVRQVTLDASQARRGHLRESRRGRQ